MTNLIEVSRIIKNFGGLAAVNDVSFNAEEGQIVSIIGPNGAGKTTLFNLITNVFPPTSGRILFKGRNISGMPSHRISALGIARTFQNIGLFREMTALENIMVGLYGIFSYGFVSSALRLPWMKRNEAVIREQALKAIERIHLEDKAHMLAANLPYGDQKLLELGRAIAINPFLLLVDEPGAGLNETEKENLIQLILEVKKQGITVLLVEHDMGIVMRISNKVLVLNFGERIAEGSPEEISKNPEVIKAYLGEDQLYVEG
jgi:branched-chain amino acid transport system ATP-binding protein